MTTKIDPNEWAKRLEPSATRLLTWFTTEQTRRDGRQLYLISLISILLSIGLVSITEASLGVLTIKSPGYPSQSVPILNGITCIYFLMMYCFNLGRDWLINAFPSEIALDEFIRIGNEIVNEIEQEKNETTKRYDALKEEIDRRLVIRLQKSEELITFHKEEDEGLDEEQFFNEHKERREYRQKCHDELCADGVDELQEELMRLSIDRLNDPMIERLKKMMVMYRKKTVFFKVCTVAEIILPCFLCVFAIIMSVFGDRILSLNWTVNPF